MSAVEWILDRRPPLLSRVEKSDGIEDSRFLRLRRWNPVKGETRLTSRIL